MDWLEFKGLVKLVIVQHPGRKNAITGGVIALEEFGLKDDRKVRLAIDELIDDGFPVGSATDSPAGYFFPTLEEARECYGKWRHRGLDICVRARKMLKAAKLYHEGAKQLELLPV
jgi:hypothetical protein